MTAPPVPMQGEAAEIKGIVADVTALLKPFHELTKIKPGEPTALDQLERVAARLPRPDGLAEGARAILARIDEVVPQLRAARQAGFGRQEAAYIATARERGALVRELDAGWRIDEIELELDRNQGRGRVRYNHEELAAWTPLPTAEDFERLVRRAREHLGSAALSDALLTDVFWGAYTTIHARQTQGMRANAELVPLPEFYREVRVELVRAELRAGSGDKRISRVEFPRWAFLYNLDLYRRLGGAVATDRRLALQTGGQAEARTLGMVTNGLDANASYKKYCYVRPALTGGE